MRRVVAAILLAVPFVFFPHHTQASDVRACSQAKNYRLTIASCTRLLRSGRLSRKSQAFALNNRGIAYQKKGRINLAIANFNESIRRYPNHPYAYSNRGEAYLLKGNADRAIADQNRAIKIRPYATAYFHRGEAYLRKGLYVLAIADFNTVIRKIPRHSRARNLRAKAMRMRTNAKHPRQRSGRIAPVKNKIIRPGTKPKKPKRSAHNNTQPGSLRIKTAEFHYALGNKFASNGQYDKAIAEFLKAAKADPKSYKTYHAIGFAYEGKGELDSALANFNKAIQLNPKSYRTYNNRGIIYYKKGKYDWAVTDYTKAIKLNPKYANGYSSRGIAHYKNGEYDQAISDFDKAVGLRPDRPGSYFRRALVYRKKGEYGLAIKDLRMAVTLNPNEEKYSQLLKNTLSTHKTKK